MSSFTNRLQHAWNAFMGRDPTLRYNGPAFYTRPDRVRSQYGIDRTILAAINNRIAIDCAAIKIRHVRVDDNGRYLTNIDSLLNERLNVEANKDQTGRAFMQDVVMSLCDEGCIAIVPTDTSISPIISSSYDIGSWRVGKIVEWYPDNVRVNLYNDRTGLREDVVLPKKMVAIIENPFYAVMNEPNSTLKRLTRKLSLLDGIDEQTSAGKLDLIIQLPYVIKTEARRQQAETRRKDIENQLSGSKYGIAYTDGTEKITQLNRPVENNLLTQIQTLTSTLYSQLSITESILNGTASEEELINYYNQTIEPILSAIVDEMIRKFLTKTARTQNQSIIFYRDPFKLTSTSKIAEIADKFTRNEILSPNELRSIVGYKPSEDPRADELRNRNLNQSNNAEDPVNVGEDYEQYE